MTVMNHHADCKPHADFCGPEDTVLHSADGVLFHIASAQLSSASGWFRALFTVPQANAASGRADTVHLTLDEDALTLEILLKLCRGLPPGLARLADLPDLERTLQAADKYEMPGAVELLPLLLYTPRMQTDAMHLYGLADRYGQADVAERAFHRLLGMRIDFGAAARMDNKALLRLMEARQSRTERFCTLLAQKGHGGPFTPENNGICSHCQAPGRSNAVTGSVHAQWMTLVVAFQHAFVVRPSVDGFEEDEQVMLQIKGLETTTCGFLTCRRVLFDWKNIRPRLQQMIDTL